MNSTVTEIVSGHFLKSTQRKKFIIKLYTKYITSNQLSSNSSTFCNHSSLGWWHLKHTSCTT
jgi:hypothetical protein